MKPAGEAVFRRVIECDPDPPVLHRYLLRVAVGQQGGRLAVIQKNPSLADRARADPTVGKVEAWARRAGYGEVWYVNLFAFRSPKPAALNGVSEGEAIGAENDAAIRRALREAETAVAAWGNANGIEPGRYQRRVEEVLALAAGVGVALCCVGELTRHGQPRHGLQWNGQPAAALFASSGPARTVALKVAKGLASPLQATPSTSVARTSRLYAGCQK